MALLYAAEIIENRWTLLPALVAVTTLIAFALYEFIRSSARVPGFGGPPGKPIVGNLWQIRQKDAPEQYRQWAKKYGPVYQIQLGNIPVLVVNSAAAAKAIFNQNSHATSSRPEFYTFHKIISDTAGTTLGTSPWSESLKRRRKAVATAVNRPAVASYIPHLDRETRVFLSEALNYGDFGKKGVNPMPLFLRMNMSIGLTLHWGTRMESQNELFHEIVHVEDTISNFRSTTGNLQDYIPLLRLNPWNTQSAQAKDMKFRRDRYMQILDKDLDERIRNGTHKPSIRANLLVDEEAQLNDLELSSLNLTLLAAGLDTMNSAVSWGIGMLAKRQDIQEKALAAIRETYSEENPLCDAADDQSCSYLVAVIKEILRFFSVTRLSLPRCTIQDFVYDNKIIPKGTVLFLNVWACNMDPELWEDPDQFRPERWLERPETPIFTFGIGGRMCIGVQLAYRELYVLFLRILNSFKIVPDGFIETSPIEGVANPASLTTQPKAYKVHFIPHNLHALEEALKQ
ncbi:3-hydroxyphenylacetate 6-hydroxylase [Cladophialophora psammophila CBS 110553]|uniref:3-hydroxyphenylacetate 6-hydroxylase n=1 Tax=Cladophialophora psammophila CBS 110553 TaxID=1182543 RepID=W9VTL9_9EURO|nr:3-hydroxyphenylacetate 6-hydroxylase [Cladophialophora psammophila CBS 110553]EXJ56355.1 3-hydroxyphenylacetate 6-hydroxylase [Cladophialophora psammophila CBS 110553]